ncbi:MAG: division/cell wall cluster transcriptional repressor MraZ [Bacteroidales bacterium]|nr:division/cell wall cluster transcriptional repressor MraZ [Bacteroidales bacterium]
MKYLIGEFNCTIDSKCRVLLPVQLKKQLSPDDQSTFIINRGFEKCLIIYLLSEWEKVSSELSRLNTYNKKKRDFVRYFLRGATPISLDTSNRLLLPKQLLDYAGIKKDIILSAQFNKIEIWSKEIYENVMTDEPEDFAKLAEEVMGEKDDFPEVENNEE